MKLLPFLTSLTLLASAAIAQADDSVTVREACDRYSCSIEFVGEPSRCTELASKKTWGSGLEAAVFVRNCLDREVSKRSIAEAK